MKKGNIARFFEQWAELLKKDEEMKSRQEPWRTFAGGPTPYVGPGPYPRPIPTHDPSGWTKAKGYAKPVLEGKELIELGIPEIFKYTFELKRGDLPVKNHLL